MKFTFSMAALGISIFLGVCRPAAEAGQHAANSAASATPPPAEPRARARQSSPPDTDTLQSLLAAQGFNASLHFKALVMTIGKTPDGTLSFQSFDFKRTSRERDTWWPASTVKLFAAIAALEKTHAAGFTPAARLTFEYPDKPLARELAEIVRLALVPSDNAEYDRLVELVGFDELHTEFFSAQNGLSSTVLLRSYFGRIRDPETKRGVNRWSPAIVVEEGGRRLELAPRTGKSQRECKDQGNCTSLADLAEAMRKIMLHEQLGQDDRFDLGPAELELLRKFLATKRERGQEVADGLQKGFGRRKLELFHKPGYALGWFSDVVFVRATDTEEKWIVAMANRPGRKCLDQAALEIGRLLARGAFKSR